MQGADTQAQTQAGLPLQLLQRVVQFSLASQKLHCLLKQQHDASGASAGRRILHFVSIPQVLHAASTPRIHMQSVQPAHPASTCSRHPVSTPRILHAVGMQSAACSQHATNPTNPACTWQAPITHALGMQSAHLSFLGAVSHHKPRMQSARHASYMHNWDAVSTL